MSDDASDRVSDADRPAADRRAAVRPVPWRVGVDLGGTMLRAAAVAADGQILSHDRRPTPRTSATDVVHGIVDAVRAVEEAAGGYREASTGSAERPNGLVIAAPGPLDIAAGRVLATPNLPHLRDFPLAGAVADALRRDVRLHNDATLAALGEAGFGAGQGYDVVLFLTISTGIGGGLVVGGRPYLGTSGQAAELGHLIVDGRPDAPRCGAGHAGCLEAHASGRAIARAAAEAGFAGSTASAVPPPDAGAPSIAGPPWSADARTAHGATTADVARAARAGDPIARSVLENAAHWLGLGVASAINAFDPAIVVLGGGVMGAWDLLSDRVLSGVEANAMSDGWRRGGVVVGALGDDAGVVGAALGRLDDTDG